MPASHARFGHYVFVGTAIGLTALLLLNALERVAGSTPVGYALSVLAVYAVAVYASFLLQGTVTYGAAVGVVAPRQFVRFLAIALVAGACASAFAAGLRYLSPLRELPAAVSGAVSFAFSSIFVSAISFRLNGRYVFAGHPTKTRLEFGWAGEVFLLTSATLLGSLLWSLAAGQDYNWDQLNYHLYAGLSALNDRFTQDFFAASIQSYLNPYSFVPFYLLVHWGLPAALVVATLAALHALNLVVAHGVALRLLPRPEHAALRVLSVALAAATPVFLVEIGTSFNDVIASVPMAAGLMLLLFHDRWGSRALFLSGLLSGLAVALKLTNVPFAVGIALGALVLGSTRWERLSSLSVVVVGGLAGFMVAGGYWVARLLIEFGSPVFPFFNGVFQAKDYPAHSIQHHRFLPQSLFEAALHPVRMALPDAGTYTETSAPDVRFLFALAACLVLALLWLRRRAAAADPARLAFVVSFWAGFVGWLGLSGNGRYLMPLAVLCGPLLVWATVCVFRSSMARMLALGLAAVTQVVGVAIAADQRWTAVPWSRLGWYELELPGDFQTQRALYLSLDPQPAAFLAAFASPDAGFVNLVGQNTLWPESPGGRRVSALIESNRERTFALFGVHNLDEFGAPELPPRRKVEFLLAPFGLDVVLEHCGFAKLHNLPSTRKIKSGDGIDFKHDGRFRAFAVCPTRLSAAPWEEQRRVLASGFRELEQACPRVLRPALEPFVLHGSVATKFYVDSDAVVSIEGRRFRVSGYHIPMRSYLFNEDGTLPSGFVCPTAQGWKVE